MHCRRSTCFLAVIYLTKRFIYVLEKLAEATRKYANLSEELDDFLQFESTKTTFFAGSKLSVSWRHHESARKSVSEQLDSKFKENGAVCVKLSGVDSDEKQDSEGVIRRRRSKVSTTVENKKPVKQSIKEKKRFRKMHDLKLAFSEFYLSLVLLQNYQTLNFTGFRKILKKHDKVSFLQYLISWTNINWLEKFWCLEHNPNDHN